MQTEIVFLKLGGSLITEKDKPHTPRQERIIALAYAIAQALEEQPNLRLVLGHGSGSFGHVEAARHGTRQGVRTVAEWRGFAEVWYAAHSLSRLVMDALHTAGIAAVAFPPSAAAVAEDGQIARWETSPITAALRAGLVAVTYGDVAFDSARGGTIISTEEAFAYLAPILQPKRILIAGEEEGVWADYPKRTRLITAITPRSMAGLNAVGGSAATDVTGGMLGKVQILLRIVEQTPKTEAFIFSGMPPENVRLALSGMALGTKICNSEVRS